MRADLPYTTDTSAEAHEVQLQLIRSFPPVRNAERALRLSRQVKNMALASIRRVHPDKSDVEIRLLFIEQAYGKELANGVRETSAGGHSIVTGNDDLIPALSPVVAAFRELNVSFYIGGSVASSYHGAARSTVDVDVICDLKRSQVDRFVTILGDEFYSSPSAILSAIDRKSCFNLIHLTSSFKVDVFILRERPFDIGCMRRAQLGQLSSDSELRVPIATPEDMIIAKLEWFRATGESSDRQWNDVTWLCELHGPKLDREALTQAAESVGVKELLVRLLSSHA
ncbi:MAG: hypothetical protein U0892_12145 [Pirellulales bacterium]